MLNDDRNFDSKFGIEIHVENIWPPFGQKTVENWINWIFCQFQQFFGQRGDQMLFDLYFEVIFGILYHLTSLRNPFHMIWSFEFLTSHISAYYIINPRHDGGCWEHPPPSVFSRIAENRRCAEPPISAFLISHPFHTFSENYLHRSSQVRPPGQVMSPYLLKSLWC